MTHRKPSRPDLVVVECPAPRCNQLICERSRVFAGTIETVCPRCKTKVEISADGVRILERERR